MEEDKRKTIYLASTAFPGPTMEEQVREAIVYLDITDVKIDNFDIRCPKLEDDTFCERVEILFADLRVIKRYWRKLKNLKWAHTYFNGVDIFLKSLGKDETPKFMLTRQIGSINAPYISDYVIGHVVAKERYFFEAREAQNNKEWTRLTFVHNLRTLSSLTIGILGVGYIGKYLAKMCKSLGMTVWGLTRNPHAPEDRCPDVDEYRTPQDLSEMLRNCDYICNLLPSTEETRGLLSGEVLSVCKQKKTVFINVGRGDVIDEDTIIKSIKEGWLGGAILDVFWKEPLPSTSPLWTLPGVTISPHSSGFSISKEFMDRSFGLFLDNHRRYLAGEPLVGKVEFNRGY